MKKDILLIANYWHFEEEKSSSRYRSFGDVLSGDYDLEVVTSSFCHLKKSQRNAEELKLDKLPYKMTLQYEKGYKRNISLERIASYTQFGKNVLAYLKKRKKPDLIILSVPSLAAADYVSKFAKKNNIPLILDIQDLWPEAFKMALNIPVLSDILFAPMMWQANRIYSRADVIMAVSDTYVKRGKKKNKKADTLSIYIGTDSELVKEKTAQAQIPPKEAGFEIGYIGALGHSYDIKGVIDAVKILNQRGINDITFKVMGTGVCKEEYENYAKEQNVNCVFTGLMEYGAMMKTLMQCDIAVNPIIGSSVSSIINKVADYSAAGIPVVNTQNSPEYRELLERFKAGISVKNGNAEELANAIYGYYRDSEIKQLHGKNQTKMFEELFDRQKNYIKIIPKIEELTNEKCR